MQVKKARDDIQRDSIGEPFIVEPSIADKACNIVLGAGIRDPGRNLPPQTSRANRQQRHEGLAPTMNAGPDHGTWREANVSTMWIDARGSGSLVSTARPKPGGRAE